MYPLFEETSVEPVQVDYELFNAKTFRVVYRQKLTASDAAGWNGRLKDAFCGHLQWQKKSESKVRSYTVKRA